MLRIAFLIFTSVLLFTSCTNDLEKIKKVTMRNNDPEERTTELYLIQTDGGKATIRLYAKTAESFSTPDKIVVFNNGLKVEFYNNKGKLSSILTAKYGKINESQGTMEVLDSVRVFNPLKDQRMETEALYWDKKDSLITTDKLVSIKTPTALIYGEGLKMKQDFSYYEFIKPQGKIKTK
jgi:LPS export ABC transporter protein LptC